ncbi:hypothetical protein M3J07_003952 [Ascochyta lentis]
MSIEWVGDMSGPSTILDRSPSLCPEPGLLIESLMDQVGDIEELRPPGTVEEDAAQCPKGSLNRIAGRRPTVSFSNKINEQSPPVDQSPNASQALLLQDPRTRQRPRTNAFTRSQLEAAEPNKRPNLAKLSPQLDLAAQDARKWPQLRKAPLIASHRARRFLASHASSHSSHKDPSSEQNFFTPPSTRHPSTRHPSTREDRGSGKAVFQTGSESDGSVESPHQVARSAGRYKPDIAGRSQPLAAANHKLFHVKSLFLSGGRPSHDVPSDISSQSSVNRNRADVDEPTSSSRKKKSVNVPIAETSSSHGFSSSLYSRPKSRVFRSHSKAMDGGIDVNQNPVCGRRKSFSFENGLHALEALEEQQYSTVKRADVWTGGEREEISRLRDDNAVLKKQISNLRGEFRMLRDVLLQAESIRRWREIECSS